MAKRATKKSSRPLPKKAPAAKKALAKRPVAKKPAANKPAAKRPVAKKAVAKTSAARTSPTKKAAAKKALTKKSAAKKPVAKTKVAPARASQSKAPPRKTGLNVKVSPAIKAPEVKNKNAKRSAAVAATGKSHHARAAITAAPAAVPFRAAPAQDTPAPDFDSDENFGDVESPLLVETDPARLQPTAAARRAAFKPAGPHTFIPGADGPLSEDPKRRQQQESSQQFAFEVARLCRDDKCSEVLLLDVRGLSHISDYIILGSGTSDRQMKSVLDHVAELGHHYGFMHSKTNADERSTWLLIDFADVTVHLFEPGMRAHYDLEMLWGDAPRLEWERPDQVERDRAGLSTSPSSRR